MYDTCPTKKRHKPADVLLLISHLSDLASHLSRTLGYLIACIDTNCYPIKQHKSLNACVSVCLSLNFICLIENLHIQIMLHRKILLKIYFYFLTFTGPEDGLISGSLLYI